MPESPFEMDSQRVATFLGDNFYGAVATLRKNGSPLATPVGVLWRDEAAFISMRADSTGTKRTRNDPRVSLTVFSVDWPPSYVVIEGNAEETADDDHEIKTANARPTVQMMGLTPDEADAWVNDYVQIPRVVFKIVPSRIVTMDGDKIRNSDMGKFVLRPASA